MILKRRLPLLLVLASMALSCCAFGQTGGRDLYIAKCSACHARDGSGDSTVGRSLKLSDVRPAIKSMTDEQLRQLILEGKGKMPGNKKLDDEKIRNLTEFLRDLVAGNPETGQAVAEVQAQPLPNVNEVFRDKCSACHGRDGKGGTTIGRGLNIPDLTSTSVQSKGGEELAEIISQGKDRMPAYAKRFNPVQIGQLAAYIQAFARTEAQKRTPHTVEERAAPAQEHSPSTPAGPQPPAVSATPSPARDSAPENSPQLEEKEAETRAAPAPSVKKTLTGRQMYIAKCSACHSSDGSGTGTIGKSMKIPSLLLPQVQAKSDEALTEVIDNGVGKMPGYDGKLKKEQIEQLVSFIRQLAKK